MSRTHPNVLWVVADSMRPDFLGCYDTNRSTPTLDGFAREGLCFQTTYAAAPWTVPSLAAMFTGRFAHRMGLVKWEQPYPNAVATLFHHLRDAGITVGSFPFDPTHLFVNCPEAGTVCSSQDTISMHAWLRARRGGGTFAFVHHWWTHVPYLQMHMPLDRWNRVWRGLLTLLQAPDPENLAKNRRHVIGLYEQAIQRFSEQWLPALVEAMQPDLLLVTSDHGESWGERLAPGVLPRDIFDLHGNHLFDEVMRIPWVMHGPQLLPSGRVHGLARSVDMLPTLLELLDLPPSPEALDGRSLRPYLENGTIPADGWAHFCRNADFVDLPTLPQHKEDVFTEFGCVHRGRKGVRAVGSDDTRIYDLATDPAESSPTRTTTATGDGLVQALDQAWEQTVVGPFEPSDHAQLRARLAALGYL